MKYIRFWFDIGCVTGDDERYVAYLDSVTNPEIMNDGEAFFLEHCDNYSYLFMSSDAGLSEDELEFDEDDYEEEYQNYIDNWCSWGYEEVSELEYLEATQG